MANLHSKSLYEKMLLHSPDMLCIIDRNGRFVDMGEACKHILGYTRIELAGKPYIEYVLPEDRERTFQTAQRIMNGHSITNFKNRYRRKEGTITPVIWSAAWSEEEGLMFCIARKLIDQGQCTLDAKVADDRYKATFNNHTDGIFFESRKGIVTEANNAFCQIVGLCETKLTGVPASSFLPQDMASVNQVSWQQALLGSTMRFDLELDVEGKGRRVFDTVKQPVIINDEIVGVQTTAKDITPIVRSHELMEQQTKKLNDIFESITDAFFALDRDWHFTYVNSVLTSLIGYQKEDLIGKRIHEQFPMVASTLFFSKCKEACESKVTAYFEESFPTFDTTYRFKVYPSAEGVSVYFTDITQQKQMQKELEKLSLVASKTNNSVIIADKDWRIEWVNDGFTRLMGYSMEEAVGKKPSELLHNHKTDRTAYEQLEGKLLSGEQVSFYVLNMKKDGGEVWLNVEITAIFDEFGALSRFVEIHTDITALKTSEQDLFAQNRDLQQFTYIISHNLRAPVANALGLVSMMTKVDRSSNAFDVSMAHLKASLVRMDTVLKDVNTILSIRERQGVHEREQVRLVGVINQALSHLQESLIKFSAEVNVDVDEGATVAGNSGYLFGVFYNLLTNAIKFRSPERHLVVKVRNFKDSSGFTLITFSDNGIGFDVEKAGDNVFRLYKRFHKDKGGRGIGLFLVKTYVEVMGGQVEVQSQIGVGTTFSIYLPKHE